MKRTSRLKRVQLRRKPRTVLDSVMRPSKYKNRSCTYNGATYHSRKEADFAASLDQLRKAKDPKERVVMVWSQINIPLIVNGVKVCTYIPDFEVEYADGRVELIEVKGMATDVWKLKHKLLLALHPERSIRVVR